jgi:hypothetical protein
VNYEAPGLGVGEENQPVNFGCQRRPSRMADPSRDALRDRRRVHVVEIPWLQRFVLYLGDPNYADDGRPPRAKGRGLTA